jgi:hypothetical protein
MSMGAIEVGETLAHLNALKRLHVFVAALVASAILIPASAFAVGGARTLVATVGPGHNIRLQTSSGRVVTRLQPGSYTIVVHDRSRSDNFHLSGPPTLSRKTGIAYTGTKRWVVTLTRGSWTYQSDRHPATMHGSFRVR